MKAPDNRITLRSLAIGTVLCMAFAWWTVLRDQQEPFRSLAAAQIPLLPYVFLFLAAIGINPALKRLRFIRPLSLVELLTIFSMTAVSAGIASYGATRALLPVISGLSNSNWNNMGWRKWDSRVEPFLNEGFFVAVKGARARAMQLRLAEDKYNTAWGLLRTAKDLRGSETELHRVSKAIAVAESIGGFPPSKLERQLRLIRKAHELSREAWEEIGKGLDPKEVCRTHETMVESLRIERDTLRFRLHRFKESAFQTIRTFREGLPDTLRAFPGFAYRQGEGLAAYRARLRRLSAGRKAYARLRQADQLLATAVESQSLSGATLATMLQEASGILAPVSRLPELSREEGTLREEMNALEEQIESQSLILRKLRHARRFAIGEHLTLFDDRIETLSESNQRLIQQREELNLKLDTQIMPPLRACGQVREVRDSLEQIAREVSETADVALLRTRVQSQMARFHGFDASLRRFLLGDIDWSPWVGPLLRWGFLIALTYFVLMTFNQLVFWQWSQNEKLIYPLAELPSIITGGLDKKEGSPPGIFRNGLFWVGFSVSAGILAWNHLAKEGIIPNTNPIGLIHPWKDYVTGGFFDALRKCRFEIMFSVIGLTFLVPANISFSLWSFEILSMVILVIIAVTTGEWQGDHMSRALWNSELTYRNGLGAGAVLVFASFVIYGCRKYIFSAFRTKGLEDIPQPQVREIRISSWAFLVGSLGLIATMSWGLKVHPLYATLFWAVILCVTIALMRSVCEGGVLGLKCYFNPFHVIRNVFGMDKSWSFPGLFAPLWAYHAILFMDMKSFIAPQMANVLKIRENLGTGRWRFHVAIWIGILCTMAVSFLGFIFIGFDKGVDSMRYWANNKLADEHVFTSIGSMITHKPVDTTGGKWWMLAGGLAMVGLLLGRRKFFSMPHPIGLIMFINPFMVRFWGSILLGWIFKSLVSKYGNKENYARIRGFFVGLIVGELILTIMGWQLLDF